MRIGSKTKEQHEQEKSDARARALADREKLLSDIATWSTYQIVAYLFPLKDLEVSDDIIRALEGRFFEIASTEEEFGTGIVETCHHGHEICSHGQCWQMCEHPLCCPAGEVW